MTSDTASKGIKKNTGKSALLLLVCFLSSCLMAAMYLAVCGLYPGSEKTLILFDVREQFVSFYASLRYIGIDGNTPFYSFYEALGGGYIGLWAYYLASPLSLFTLLFDIDRLPDAIWLMDVLKSGLCAVSFGIYLISRRKKSDTTGIEGKIWFVLFCLAYAFMSEGVMFYILPMYTEALILLPFIILGSERIFDSGKPHIFIISAVLIIYLQYYTAYMIAIFTLLYAIYYSASESYRSGREHRAKAWKIYVLSGIVSVALSCPLLIPVLKSLISGKAGDKGVYSDGSLFVCNPLKILASVFPASYDTIYSDGAPLLYCGLIFAAISVFVIACKERGQRTAAVCVIAAMLISFFFRPVYRIWHMFRDPVAYPHRFAFLLSFFILSIASESSLRDITDALGRLLNGRLKRFTANKVFNPALMTIMFAGVSLNAIFVIKGMQAELPGVSRSDYLYQIDTTRPLIEEAKSDDGFYRIEKDDILTSNDGLFYGYKGLSFFSSDYNADLLKFCKDMGLLQYHYKTFGDGSTPFTDRLLGVRYRLAKYDIPSFYNEIDSNGYYRLTELIGSGNVGFFIAGDIPEEPEFTDDPFKNQVILQQTLWGGIDIFRDASVSAEWMNGKTPVKEADGSYTLVPVKYTDIDMDEAFVTLYGFRFSDRIPSVYELKKHFESPDRELPSHDFYLNFRLQDESELSYDEKSEQYMIRIYTEKGQNERLVASFLGFSRSYNAYLGNIRLGEGESIHIDGAGYEREPLLYMFDSYAYSELTDRMLASARHLSDPTFDKGVMKLRVSADDDGFILLSIPYSDGFKAYMDDSKTDCSGFLGAFTVIKVPEGEHDIALKYGY